MLAKIRQSYNDHWPLWWMGVMFLLTISAILWLGFTTGWDTPVDYCY